MGYVEVPPHCGR